MKRLDSKGMFQGKVVKTGERVGVFCWFLGGGSGVE